MQFTTVFILASQIFATWAAPSLAQGDKATRDLANVRLSSKPDTVARLVRPVVAAVRAINEKRGLTQIHSVNKFRGSDKSRNPDEIRATLNERDLEKTRDNEKARDTEKTRDADKFRDTINARDLERTRDTEKARDSEKTRDADKFRDTINARDLEKTRDTEKAREADKARDSDKFRDSEKTRGSSEDSDVEVKVPSVLKRAPAPISAEEARARAGKEKELDDKVRTQFYIVFCAANVTLECYRTGHCDGNGQYGHKSDFCIEKCHCVHGT